MTTTRWAIVVLLVMLAGAGTLLYRGSLVHAPLGEVIDSEYRTEQLVMGGHTFTAEISDTPELREEGLSGRASIADDQAMLFVFDAPGEHLFWMKDMRFPIDMVWLSADNTIVSVAEHVLPETYPDTFGAGTISLYVVEVKAGTVARLGLTVGQKISLEPTFAGE